MPVLAPDTDERAWLSLLEPAERERIARFQSDPARRTFLTSRATQRTVAACYLGGPPARVRIDRDCLHCGAADHGRPRVRGAGALDLSVTHAGEWVVVAVVGTGAVGVDLEPGDRATRDMDGLAGAVLGPAERAAFDALAGDERTAWFYWCWTRKEAAAKLTGHGLSLPLQSLDVHADRVSLDKPPDGWPTTPIHLADAPAPPGYAAALATTVPLARTLLFTTAPPTG